MAATRRRFGCLGCLGKTAVALMFGGTSGDSTLYFWISPSKGTPVYNLPLLGSFSRAFLPDGTLYLGPARSQPKAGAPLTVAFHEVPWSGWLADCRAGR